MDLKQTAYHIINSDPGHTQSNQQLDKNLKITFAIPPKSADENEKGREREREREKKKPIAKPFALCANAIMTCRFLRKKYTKI